MTEIYDPATGLISRIDDMVFPRASHTSTILADGRVLIAGGVGPGDVMITLAEIFDPGFFGLHTRSAIVKKAAERDYFVVPNGAEIVEYSAETAVLVDHKGAKILKITMIGNPW